MATSDATNVKSVTYSRRGGSQQEVKRSRKRFTPRKRTSESEDDGICDLCVQQIKVYAIGYCNHPICHRCSAKMRVLCEQSHCAICREEMRKIIYAKTKRPFQEANELQLIKYKANVFFTDDIVKKEYEKLLEHRCMLCPERPPESTFSKLEVHMRKDHQLFYCDLCIMHNKNFTDECKTYNREGLARHRRVGDDDDSSHKGHPLCEFCDDRYLDKDSLLHHLRKDHYFCHFCDHEGRNQYFDGYLDLRAHYRKEHFLCEEDDCAHEQFTSVFATELDLKAHRAAAHNQNLSRQQQKVERNIDLGFQYSNPPARGGRGGGQGSGRGRGRANNRNDFSNRDEDLDRAIALSLAEQESAKRKSEKGTSGESKVKTVRPRVQRENEPKKISQPEEPPPPDLLNDFPTLGSEDKHDRKSSFPSSSSTVEEKPKSASDTQAEARPTAASTIAAAVGRSTGKISQEDFPTLGSTKKTGNTQPSGIWSTPSTVAPTKPKQPPAKVPQPISVNKPQSKFMKSNVDLKNKEEFPTLGGTSGNTGSYLGTIWGPSMPAPIQTSTRKTKKPKTPMSNQEYVKKKTPVQKITPTVVQDSNPMSHDETISIKIGSGKHSMRLTSSKHSEDITDIEKPIEVPGMAGTSVKTVTADAFSLLSATKSSQRQTNGAELKYNPMMEDFPELGMGKGGRIRGIGSSKAPMTWSRNDKNGSRAKTTPFSLADLSKDISLSTNNGKNLGYQPVNDDFPEITKPPPLSSYASNWFDDPENSVTDSVSKGANFQPAESDFPTLVPSNDNKSNQHGQFSKKNKKKRKNKGQPTASELSKHFGNVTIDNSKSGGRLENLLKNGDSKKSLSEILGEDEKYKPVRNGAVSKTKELNYNMGDSHSATEMPSSVQDEETLEPRPSDDDIEGRNVWLIRTVQQLCSTEENFSQFKTASGSFRQGAISAERYYEKCKILLGKKHFEQVFRELVDLLPDSDKQEALLEVHANR